MIEISAFIGPVISAICAFAGSYLAFSTRLTRVEEKVSHLTNKMDDLSENVNKHNKVIERTYRLEERMDSALHSLDEVKDEVHRYHHN